MDSLKSAIPKATRLASVPLVVAYGAVPLGAAAVRATGSEITAVSTMMPWLLLAGLGILLSHKGKYSGFKLSKLAFHATLLLLAVAGVILYLPDIQTGLAPIMPYLKELSPLVFLLFALLWAKTCGLPDRADFQRFGALLATFCIIDLPVEAIAYSAVPTVRWIGNADMLAGLLLISLCASLKPGCNDGGCDEPDQGHPLWRGLILAGILTCLSRTGLFAAAWVFLCFGRGKIRWRLAYTLLCAGLLGLTFFLPPTPSDAVRYTDYWLWVEATQLFIKNPDLLLTGFPMNSPLPIAFPAGMAAIWEAATGQSSILGAFLHQVPSFWLRFGMGWGIFAPVGLLLILFTILLRHLTRMGAGLTAALFAQGMTTPLLYDPAMGVAICLGFIVAVSTPKVIQPTSSPDPVKEWDLRPL